MSLNLNTPLKGTPDWDTIINSNFKALLDYATANDKAISDLTNATKEIDTVSDALNLFAGITSVQIRELFRVDENAEFEVGSTIIKPTDDWPFNNPYVTVALAKARNNLNYIVLSFADGADTGQIINIKDRLINGFKIEVENCPKAGITVKYYVFGGMI